MSPCKIVSTISVQSCMAFDVYKQNKAPKDFKKQHCVEKISNLFFTCSIVGFETRITPIFDKLYLWQALLLAILLTHCFGNSLCQENGVCHKKLA